jgi:hypothetical protein
METLNEQRDYSELKPFQFKKGQSGNPMGRPPGRSLKDRAKAYLAGLTDEEAVSYFEGMDKKVVWEMAEGKAKQDTDITSNGESINPILVKFIGGESTDTK